MKLTVKAKDGKDAGEHEVAFDVLENAKGKAPKDAPINAVLNGATVHWAE